MTLARPIRREVLHRTKLFAGLSRDEMEELLDFVTERRFAREELVVRRGDEGASLMVLVQGRLRAGTTTADGREMVMGLVEPGGVIGEIAVLDGKPRSLDVTAMADSVALVVERRHFLPFLMRRPEVMQRLMLLLCDRLRRSSAALEDVALASLAARLARLLLNMAEDYGAPGGGGIKLRLKLSQRELSAQVAATRERVNKQLRAFKESGLIGDSDGAIVLLKLDELKAVAEEEKVSP